jgi:hypothetical protein
MERVILFFSALFQNENFLSFAWGFLGFVFGGWDTIYFWRRANLTEEELIKISPKYAGINGSYMGAGFLWFFFMLPFILNISNINNWAEANFGTIFFPSFAFFGLSYGIYQGAFAVYKGVYPQGKVLTYVYEDENLIRRVGKTQIYISLVAMIVFTALFFILYG